MLRRGPRYIEQELSRMGYKGDIEDQEAVVDFLSSQTSVFEVRIRRVK